MLQDRGTLLRLVRSKGISAHAPPDSPEGGSVWSTGSHGSQLVPTSFSPGKGRASQADAQTSPMDTVSASPPKQFANSQLSMPFKIAPQPAVLPAAAAKDVLHVSFLQANHACTAVHKAVMCKCVGSHECPTIPPLICNTLTKRSHAVPNRV